MCRYGRNIDARQRDGNAAHNDFKLHEEDRKPAETMEPKNSLSSYLLCLFSLSPFTQGRGPEGALVPPLLESEGDGYLAC